jgi:hypothetical protein
VLTASKTRQIAAGNFMLCDVYDVEVVAVKGLFVLDADGVKGAE